MRKRHKVKKNKLFVISIVFLLIFIGVGHAAFQTNINLKATGNIKNKSRNIKAWSRTSNEDFHTTFYRERIISINFLNTAKVPVDALVSWDVSESRDGGVMAYIKESKSETGKFDLFIGSKDGVVANVDSSYLFYNMTEVKDINFNDNFDTSQTTNMEYMFSQCYSILQLDVSCFDTTNVTNMKGMFGGIWSDKIYSMNLEKISGIENFNVYNVQNFHGMFGECSHLEELDLSLWNTYSAKDMSHMFIACSNLKNIYLNNFNTLNVTTTNQMFRGCKNLIVLDLSSFNTSNLKISSSMFYECINLVTIYVSSNFVNATFINSSYNMFGGCTNLVGENGTSFSSSHHDGTYARVDKVGNPGYFTLK